MAWPPICGSASTMMTDAPASRATIAAGMPAAPEPITTISASRSQWDGGCSGLFTVMTSHQLAPRENPKQLTAAPVLCHFELNGIGRSCPMADFVTTHRLTHKASLKMIEAGIAKAEALGCKVSLAVADQSCRLIAFLMMDGARHFSIITTQRKAITAASQRLPTGYAPEENALSMSVRMGDFTNVPGGCPVEVNGEVIGAVAAGGAKIEQDVEVAKAALAALGL